MSVGLTVQRSQRVRCPRGDREPDRRSAPRARECYQRGRVEILFNGISSRLDDDAESIEDSEAGYSGTDPAL